MWSGPHLGIAADSVIWEQTWAEHPFYGWERCKALQLTQCQEPHTPFQHPKVTTSLIPPSLARDPQGSLIWDMWVAWHCSTSTSGMGGAS